jgi:hypothetical protein
VGPGVVHDLVTAYRAEPLVDVVVDLASLLALDRSDQ